MFSCWCFLQGDKLHTAIETSYNYKYWSTRTVRMRAYRKWEFREIVHWSVCQQIPQHADVTICSSHSIHNCQHRLLPSKYFLPQHPPSSNSDSHLTTDRQIWALSRQDVPDWHSCTWGACHVTTSCYCPRITPLWTSTDLCMLPGTQKPTTAKVGLLTCPVKLLPPAPPLWPLTACLPQPRRH